MRISDWSSDVCSSDLDGFTFDAGPTVITDPGALGELWQLTCHEMAEDVALEPVSPFYRLNWPDGAQFDYSNDEDALRHEIAKLNPADISDRKSTRLNSSH